VPSAAERRWRGRLGGGLLAVVLALGGVAPGAAQPSSAGAPADDEITQALDRLRNDPDFAPEREIQTLRWRRPAERRAAEPPGWFAWLRGLGRWMNQSARYLIWVTAGIAGALLGMSLFRAVGRRTRFADDGRFVAPTHVGDLDIRPEALPPDIGAAARALWDAREHRAALALLYRGLLSRLAHVHRLPIRDSSTEGDCLALAAARLPRPTHEYAARLVRLWQRSVYGHEPAADSLVHRLCDEFGPTLDRPLRADSLTQGGAA